MKLQMVNFLHILQAAISEDTPELSEPDWVRLYEMSIHHSVLPLFMEGCNKYKEDQRIPEELWNNLMLESIEMIMWQAGRTEAFLSLYDKFLEAGLKPLVLKGLICRSTYQKFADHRPSGDEDIYIPIQDFEHVKDILTAEGYQMEELNVSEEVLTKAQEISFFNPHNDLHIEVHLNPMGNETKHREKMNHYFRKAFENYNGFIINGHQVYSLNHTGHFLFLFLHFYKHFTGAGVGIRQLIDILMYDRNYHDEINWLIVESIIEEMSADRLYADVVEIGRRYLGFLLVTKLKGYDIEELLEDMGNTGSFGNSTRDQTLSSRMTTTAMNHGEVSILRTVFPKGATITRGYPVLYKKPYLLPFVWILRLFKFVFLKDGSDSKLLMESVKLGKRRVMLLKKYGIIT